VVISLWPVIARLGSLILPCDTSQSSSIVLYPAGVPPSPLICNNTPALLVRSSSCLLSHLRMLLHSTAMPTSRLRHDPHSHHHGLQLQPSKYTNNPYPITYSSYLKVSLPQAPFSQGRLENKQHFNPLPSDSSSSAACLFHQGIRSKRHISFVPVVRR
jgi:hypothetical protein